MLQVNCASYNIGTILDSRNNIVRSGAHSTDARVQQIHAYLKPMYEEADRRVTDLRNWKLIPYNNISKFEKSLIKKLRRNALAGVLSNLFRNNDIICLQEIGKHKNLELIINLLPTDFDICTTPITAPNLTNLRNNRFVSRSYNAFSEMHKQNRYDCAVVWNKSRFRQIFINPTLNHRALMVCLLDLPTKTPLRATSIHAQGFSLTNPISSLKKGEDLSNAKLNGDTLFDQLVLDMDEDLNEEPLDIVAGDFNAIRHPKYLISEWTRSLANNRFQILEDARFVHGKNKIPTCYNREIDTCNIEPDGLCVIDHLYARAREGCTLTQREEREYLLPVNDFALNPSDHRPICFSVTVGQPQVSASAAAAPADTISHTSYDDDTQASDDEDYLHLLGLDE